MELAKPLGLFRKRQRDRGKQARDPYRPPSAVRHHVTVDLEAFGIVSGEDGIDAILLLTARIDVKAVPGPGACSAAGKGVAERERKRRRARLINCLNYNPQCFQLLCLGSLACDN